MMHARDALLQAYKELQEVHPAVLSNLEIRRVFRVVLLVLSNEDQVAKTWDDVRGIVQEAVEAHLPGKMQKIQPAVESVLLDVVNKAIRVSPVYISPPPYS